MYIQLIVLFFAMIGFFLDSVTPLGFADGIYYSILLTISSFYINPKKLIIYCAFYTILIIVGWYLSGPSAASDFISIGNRISSIAVLIVVTYSLYRNRILTNSLQKLTKELTITNNDLKSFSYSVAHDLKNPVSVINGFCDLLSESASEKLDSEEKEYLHLIQSANNRMKTLIDDLLNLFRIRQQKTEITLTDLSKIALECIENQKLRYADQKIDYSIQPNMTVLADSGMMRILYENLINNAVKFSSKSNVTRIEVGCKKQNSHIVYFVRDYGAGFDSKKANDIFKPFSRLHSDKEYPGTGIGLAIVKRIIVQHNGTIWAESNLGEGTIISFTLSTEDKDI